MPFYVTLFVSSSLTFPSLHHCPHVIVCISLHTPCYFSSLHHPHVTLLTSSSSHHPPHIIFITLPSSHHPPHVIIALPSSCHPPLSLSSCHPSHVTLFTTTLNDPPSVLSASHIFRQCLHVIFLTSMFLHQFTLLTIPFIFQPPHVSLLTSPSSFHPLGVTFFT